MQRWFNICKLLNVMHHINRNKHKDHLINLIDAEKAFEKIQHNFMMKALMKVGTEGAQLNIIKAKYDKLIVRILLNGEKLKPFPLKSRTRQKKRVPTLFTPIQHSPGISSQRNKARRKKKNTHKYVVKLSLFTDHMI
jgi:hypothetical protein